jgi:hypothetical protein
MRKLLIIIAVVLLFPLITTATPQKSNDVRKYKTELNLSASQISQLDKIYNNFHANFKMLAPGKDKKDNIQKRMALRKDLRKNISKVLTVDQQKKFLALRTGKTN